MRELLTDNYVQNEATKRKEAILNLQLERGKPRKT